MTKSSERSQGKKQATDLDIKPTHVFGEDAGIIIVAMKILAEEVLLQRTLTVGSILEGSIAVGREGTLETCRGIGRERTRV